MTADDLFLGIDLGTSSCKAAVIDSTGKILSVGAASYPIIVEGDGKAEQNPSDWWNAVLKSIRTAVSGGENGRIRSIGVTGQWSGTVAIDMNGNPLGNAIVWMDTRGQEIIRKVTGGFPSLSGYRIDKLLKWIRLTGGAPAHSGKDSLAHILYIKKKMPEVYGKTHKFLEPKDYLVFLLTGKMVASWDNEALLWVTDNRHPRNVEYNDDLIKLNNLDREKLPDLVSPITVAGRIREDLASSLNIASDADVISGCGDTQCSLIGVGAIEDYDTHIYLGTSSWVTAHVPFKKTDIFHNIASLPSAIPGRYFIAAEQENACSCLEFISRMLSISGEEKYSEINRLCLSSGPGSNGVIFLPWLFGERAPVENPYVRGGFFNLGLNNNQSHIIRSVMEGVAMNSRWLLHIVDKFKGRKADSVTMAGGGVISQVWPQIYADVINRSVTVVENPRYSTVRGVAMLSGIGTGFLKIDDLKVLKERSAIYHPSPEAAGKYDDIFRHFIRYYGNNKKSMMELNRQFMSQGHQ